MPDMPITAHRPQDDEMRTYILLSLRPSLSQYFGQPQVGAMPDMPRFDYPEPT